MGCRMVKRVAVWLWLASIGGCANAEMNAQEGEACIRLSQCAPGLACVQGMCTTDLAALAEAGMVPILDSGALMDAPALTDAQPDVPMVDNDSGN